MSLSGEYEPSPFTSVAEQVARYEATDGREGGTLEDRPVIIVTHRGAKSAKVHKTPLMRIEHAGCYLVVASYGGAPNHPAWYHNLIAHPEVEVRDGAITEAMTAREAVGAEKDELWQVAEAAWPHFPDYRANTQRDIPILVLEPLAPDGTQAEEVAR